MTSEASNSKQEGEMKMDVLPDAATVATRNEKVLTKAISVVIAERDQLRTEALEERASYEAELRRKELAIEELVAPLRQFTDAYDSNNVELNSQEIDLGDGTQPWPWHEEWLSWVRGLITKHAKPEAEADHD